MSSRRTTTPSTPSSESLSDSPQSSPNSSAADSPLVSFHSSDSRSFPASHSPSAIDSSPAGSLFSPISPSLHAVSRGGDWPSSVSVQSKDPSDSFWHQPELSLFSLDNFTSASVMDFSMGFDTVLFPDDTAFSATPATSGGGVINPSTDLSFSFSFPEALQHVTLPRTNADDERSGLSSSVGMSASPVTEPARMTGSPSSSVPDTSTTFPPPVSTQGQLSNDQLVNGLAAYAKQLVGLTMALPFGESAPDHSERKQDQQQPASIAPSLPNITAPIPGVSTPLSSPSPFPNAAPTAARTKTSHTTIERRYRTNLNARIQSLRAAVPALRVLEVKQGNRVGNLQLKEGTRRVGVDPDAQPGQEDVIDERGYIDGVKVARKGSKANVLGKAVEYIHVLKRREMRLKREQEGLKALVRSLVGGSELLQQWERMWRERFGGPEKDEIDMGDVDDDNDDGEDDDEIDNREMDDLGTVSGRKRKRVKANMVFPVKAKETKPAGSNALYYPLGAQSIPIMPSQPHSASVSATSSSVLAQPGKRKRGRPRKVPIPPHVTVNDVQTSFAQQNRAALVPMAGETLKKLDPVLNEQRNFESPVHSRATPGQQYLLAAFAFFSFFNSPLPYQSASPRTTSRSNHHHTYSGSVIIDSQSEDIRVGWNTVGSIGLPFAWHNALQISHLTVSLLLLLSIMAPWISEFVHRIPGTLKSILDVLLMLDSAQASSASINPYVNEEEKTDTAIRMELSSALSRRRSVPFHAEMEMLRKVLGFKTGVLGLVISLSRQVASRSKGHFRHALERQVLEQKTFLRFAELAAMDKEIPITMRIQIYAHSFKFLSLFSASAKDIATLALIIRPMWHTRSASLWRLALIRAREKIANVCRPYEAFVLENMDVDEAASTLETLNFPMTEARYGGMAAISSVEDEERVDLASPLAVLAKYSIHDFVRKHAERAFLRCVGRSEFVFAEQTNGGGDKKKLQCEIARAVIAGRSLGGCTAKLTDIFARICGLVSQSSLPESDLDAQDLEFECTVPPGGATDTDGELFALLHAISLYHRIFATSRSVDVVGMQCRMAGGPSLRISPAPVPSPPPSPSRWGVAPRLALRRCLDSPAFDRNDALEDARDCVVDMLTTVPGGRSDSVVDCLGTKLADAE